ncbi:MAG: hypothetical protein FJ363_04565 [Gemmatimonadetes bacterium]|nr:hypothetical protein [Gemmatimonadota bacterium]
MDEVSVVRLYVLRATYLLIVVGVGLMIWPLLLGAPEAADHFRGVTWCLLSTVALLAVLGIRYPLKMLPLLLFELIWKATWVIAIGLPRRGAGQLDGAFSETWFANVMGLVIFTLAIPWGYVIRRYVREPGDRWSWSKASNRTAP